MALLRHQDRRCEHFVKLFEEFYRGSDRFPTLVDWFSQIAEWRVVDGWMMQPTNVGLTSGQPIGGIRGTKTTSIRAMRFGWGRCHKEEARETRNDIAEPSRLGRIEHRSRARRNRGATAGAVPPIAFASPLRGLRMIRANVTLLTRCGSSRSAPANAAEAGNGPEVRVLDEPAPVHNGRCALDNVMLFQNAPLIN
jgi:hypothetical protein